MKHQSKTFLIFLLSALCFSISSTAQTKDNYTNDAMVVSESSNYVVISSSGIHEKKKEAVRMAVLSAFDTYFFSGIHGLNNGEPLIKGEMTKAQEDYVERIIKEGRYVQFVRNIEETDDSPVKLPGKKYKATVTFELLTNAFDRDLIRSKVKARPQTTAETVEKLPMFTMTIVPFKKENESFSKALHRNSNVRPVIARIESKLKNSGYEIKDFLSLVDATERNMQFEMDKTAVSNDNMLINQTQADVYITVDVKTIEDYDGGEGVVTLKAYEVSTGNVLCSDYGHSRRYRKYNPVSLYERALDGMLDRFINQLTESWSKKETSGKLYTVRFTISPESAIDMTEEVGDEALPLSSVLTQWIKNNSANNKYHLLGYSDEGIFFDKIFIKDGDELNFNNKLYKYLRDELGLTVNTRQSGNTFYITIQ